MTTDAPATTAVLGDLTVVECSTFVAGPYATLLLRQLGAQVVKVDLPGGGSDRHRWPTGPEGGSYFWHGLNAGKRSVEINYRCPEGRELLETLVTLPDPGRGVYVDNVVGRHALKNSALSARRPDLIHFHVQGYPDGRPAVDYLVNAEVGLPFMSGPEALAGPVNHVLPAWDLLAGATTAMGVLAAVLRRHQGNGGTYAEVTLSDVALAAVGTLGWLSEAASTGDRPRNGNHVFGNFGVDFPTSDGHRVMVLALTEGQWRALCSATGTEQTFRALEAAFGVNLADESVRYEFRETIVGVLKPWFLARDHEEVARELAKAQVLWAPYRWMSEAAQECASGGDGPGMLMQQPGVGAVVATRSAIRSSLGREKAEIAAPLGSDTEDILVGTLGLTSRELGRLIDSGVVGA